MQAAHAALALDLPIVIGGGIGTGRQLAAVLAMGADAAILGTRMLVADELWVHDAWKQRIVQGDGTEIVIVKKALRDYHRVYRNDSAEAVLALDEAKVSDFEQFRPHVMGTLAQQAYLTGDPRWGMLDYGLAAVFADRCEPMQAIFDRLIDDDDDDDDAAAAHRLQALQAPPADSKRETKGVNI